MKKYILAALVLFSFGVSFAQPVLKSGYFLNGMLNRHKINPAIIQERGYVGIPVLSDLSISVSTNLGVGKFLFPMSTGGLTTFMNGSVSASKFLSGLSAHNKLDMDFSTDLIGFAFYAGKSYNTVGVSLRSYTGLSLPYSLFDFMKSGMTSPDVTRYSIDNIMARTTNFLDVSYGYARPINSNITVGAKIKFLVGIADLEARIDHMDISMSQNEWIVNNRGTMLASGMGMSFLKNEANKVGFGGIDIGGFEIGGYGLGFDIGATYKTPVKGLNVSLAVVDLGFISWKNTSRAATVADEFRFKGFSDIPVGGQEGGVSVKDQLNNLTDQAAELFNFQPVVGRQSNTTALRATLNVGVEYEIFPDKFSVGLLSSTRFDKDYTLAEFIVSANYKPKSWFNAALTADISNIAFSWGALINFCPSFINFFAGVEFMVTDITPQFLPLNSASPRISIGLNVPIGKRHKYIMAD